MIEIVAETELERRDSKKEPFTILQVMVYSGEFYLLEEQVTRSGPYSGGQKRGRRRDTMS